MENIYRQINSYKVHEFFFCIREQTSINVQIFANRNELENIWYKHERLNVLGEFSIDTNGLGEYARLWFDTDFKYHLNVLVGKFMTNNYIKW